MDVRPSKSAEAQQQPPGPLEKGVEFALAMLRERGHSDVLAPIAAAEAARAQQAKDDASRAQSYSAQGKAATKRVADIETAIAKKVIRKIPADDRSSLWKLHTLADWKTSQVQ